MICEGPGGQPPSQAPRSCRGLSQPTIYHHLRLLKQVGLIDSERGGTWVYGGTPPPSPTPAASNLLTISRCVV
ncbi:helix-turn-helix domain-containing protein [Streptomyces sp. x-80]|uniref:helix-turn-helix domain-containing protein n=1 Tax=Streptomyces sp. x-80 TaxID=2789282 RepID=UPI00398093B4